MNDGILKFKKQLDKSNTEKKRWDEANTHQRLLGFYEFYRFSLSSEPTGMHISKSYPDVLIVLDEEDIQYFVNKYFPKLQDEMNRQINQIKEEYEK